MRLVVMLGVAAVLLSPAFAFDLPREEDTQASLTVEEGVVYLRDGTVWEEGIDDDSCASPNSDCSIHLEDALYDKIMRGGYVFSRDGVTTAVKSMPEPVYAAE